MVAKNEEMSDQQEALEQQIAELTADLQRTRADFENYRKRMEQEKATAHESGQASAILKLLPVIDTIERATTHMPDDLKDHKWAQGIAGLVKNLDKALEGMNLRRIDATPGTEFNPDLHEAIQFDEEAAGDKEVIATELQAGYTLNGHPIRPAMVKVTRQ
ncbi:nucleotide exchange factor GrpE [Streptomyces caniscabiei]|uniref:nucleotide exchange factor GrpE n=1 Tax=Streptomyces caniscabiei TaxID=2746961 RepID=UPI0029AA9384|nr:nucleotide exchange factor GrpE [Streptomyces caniscabiei]MDX2776522.1 nucleotide exchange factor GrpE [Streptomyces caniscabiei]